MAQSLHMGDPRRDLARVVAELEKLVDEGADQDLILAKTKEASAALKRFVEAGEHLIG